MSQATLCLNSCQNTDQFTDSNVSGSLEALSTFFNTLCVTIIFASSVLDFINSSDMAITDAAFKASDSISVNDLHLFSFSDLTKA
jgi:UDP-glucose 4-epimerase